MSAENTVKQPSELFQKIRNGDRIALSRAITLIESRQTAHIAEANALLDACMSTPNSAMRIAISGAPGVGKSSFIEAVSVYILDDGFKLAVLAIDPSSQVTGGSLLGDKTRMQSLANHPNAYVRPSPAGVNSGGVAERTREAVMLCAAAGYDVVMVETIGVGQSDVQVRTMVDVLALLITPGGGDEVQGIKRGILEVADLVLVNKADGDMLHRAQETKAQYLHALRILHDQESMPAVLTCSAQKGSGVEDAWHLLKQRFDDITSSGELQKLRNAQQITWFEYRLQREFQQALMHHPDISVNFEKYKRMIAAREISVRSALSAMQLQLSQILK